MEKSDSLNDIIKNKLDNFIEIIINKLKQISIIEKNEYYKIHKDILKKDKSYKIIKILKKYTKNNEKIYNYIRIYIDHCINIIQIILFDIKQYIKINTNKNIYNKHNNSNITITEIYTFNYNIKLVYILTQTLANTLIGLNNLNLNENYYNLLIWDIKKIVISYVTNNLNILYKYSKLLKEEYNIEYNELIKILNIIIYSNNNEMYLL